MSNSRPFWKQLKSGDQLVINAHWTHVWDKLRCRGVWRLLSDTAWRALPHLVGRVALNKENT